MPLYNEAITLAEGCVGSLDFPFICLQFSILAPLNASRGPSGIRGADAKEQSLTEHKKLPKEAGNSRASIQTQQTSGGLQAGSGARAEEKAGTGRARSPWLQPPAQLSVQSSHPGDPLPCPLRPITASVTMAVGDRRASPPSLGLNPPPRTARQAQPASPPRSRVANVSVPSVPRLWISQPRAGGARV